MQPWNSILNDLKKVCFDGSQTEYSMREPNPPTFTWTDSGLL